MTLAPPVVVLEELPAGAVVEHSRLPNIKEVFYVITQRRHFENRPLRELTARRD